MCVPVPHREDRFLGFSCRCGGRLLPARRRGRRVVCAPVGVAGRSALLPPLFLLRQGIDSSVPQNAPSKNKNSSNSFFLPGAPSYRTPPAPLPFITPKLFSKVVSCPCVTRVQTKDCATRPGIIAARREIGNSMEHENHDGAQSGGSEVNNVG